MKNFKTRRFAGAAFNNGNKNWLTSDYQSFTREIASDLSILRARSRDITINNVYGRRIMKAFKDGVVGSKGFRLSVKARDISGKLDTFANNLIEFHFNSWAKKATVDGQSLNQTVKTIVQSLIRDGEVIVFRHRGKQFGKYGFQISLVDPMLLDHRFDRNLKAGKYIRAGVEYDKMHRPIALHIFNGEQNDPKSGESVKRKRIDLKDALHIFDKERAGQGRGFPWVSAAMFQLYQLEDFRTAELNAAREAAKKIKTLTRPMKDTGSDLVDEEDESNNVGYTDLTDITVDVLPDGYTLDVLDPKHPNTALGDFQKAILKGISASMGAAYYTISGDMDANYSSARVAMLQENETFREVQAFLIEAFLEPVYEDWLKMTLLTGIINLPIEKFEKFNTPVFRGRNFPWIDPAKEAIALKTLIGLNLKSRTQIVAEMFGCEYDEVLEEIQGENQVAEALGISLTFEPTNNQEISQGSNKTEKEEQEK